MIARILFHPASIVAIVAINLSRVVSSLVNLKVIKEGALLGAKLILKFKNLIRTR